MNATILPKPSEYAEWQKARYESRCLGASDVAVLFGCHEFVTLADLATERLTGIPAQAENASMARGKALEQAIAEAYEEQTGIPVVQPEVMFRNGRLIANPDRLIASPGPGAFAVECKSEASFVSEPKPMWVAQVQAQMAAWPECEAVDIACMSYEYVRTGKVQVWTVERDEEMCAEILRRVEWFWAALDKGEVPDGAELSHEHLARIYPYARPASTVEVDHEVLAAALMLREARQRGKTAGSDEDAAKTLIAQALGDNESATYKGMAVLTWKTEGGGARLDEKRLLADHPELGDVLDGYRTPSTRRVMRATKHLDRALERAQEATGTDGSGW